MRIKVAERPRQLMSCSCSIAVPSAELADDLAARLTGASPTTVAKEKDNEQL
jgi:hypothetical protein